MGIGDVGKNLVGFKSGLTQRAKDNFWFTWLKITILRQGGLMKIAMFIPAVFLTLIFSPGCFDDDPASGSPKDDPNTSRKDNPGTG